MADVRFVKTVAALPASPTPSTLYFVRVGVGFDQYLTNEHGVITPFCLNSQPCVPTGSVFWFAAAVPPQGYLECNGQLLSRLIYADLFAVIGTTFGAGDGSTTFALPDLRGEFVRGWSHGRNVDSGRAFGTAQANQNLSHSHTTSGTAANSGAHTHNFPGRAAASGAWVNQQNPTSTLVVATDTTASAGVHSHNTSGTALAAGGTEARPRNVALLPCIKI